MKPVIALVGRPNVGKSTLFNRLTRTRDAIVADFAGLTRDRHYGQGQAGGREYIVIDTGGFEPAAETGIVKEMARQTQQAVAEADVVLFVVDARAGLSVCGVSREFHAGFPFGWRRNSRVTRICKAVKEAISPGGGGIFWFALKAPLVDAAEGQMGTGIAIVCQGEQFGYGTVQKRQQLRIQ